MVRKDLIILAAIVSTICAQDSSYIRESKEILDKAEVVESNRFQSTELQREFSAFATRQCADGNLARLILAPTQKDLAKAVNAVFLDLTRRDEERIALSWPSYF